MPQSEIGNPKSKILVMHTGGWIGDMILLTPALRALRKELPKAHISILVRPLVRDLMKRNPYLHEVMVYDKRGKHRGIRQMRKFGHRLNAKRFDTAIILHPNSIRSALLAYIAGIPERVGANMRGRELLLTAKVKRRDDIHEVQRYLDVISPVVGTGHDGRLEFWGVGRDDEAFADSILAGHAGPVIGINPCTTWPSKQWPAERFARLADLLAQQFGACVLITGGPGDFHIADRITKLASSEPVNLIGSTTIWQLGALIKRCCLYITCDSGPMHISVAVDTPTIALFGPTDPVRHGPYGSGHKVMRKETRCSPCYQRECKRRDCMNAIQVEDIMKVVESRLVE